MWVPLAYAGNEARQIVGDVAAAAEENGHDANGSYCLAGERSDGVIERRLHLLEECELDLSVCLLRNRARQRFERSRPLALARAVREEDDALAQ